MLVTVSTRNPRDPRSAGYRRPACGLRGEHGGGQGIPATDGGPARWCRAIPGSSGRPAACAPIGGGPPRCRAARRVLTGGQARQGVKGGAVEVSRFPLKRLLLPRDLSPHGGLHRGTQIDTRTAAPANAQDQEPRCAPLSPVSLAIIGQGPCGGWPVPAAKGARKERNGLGQARRGPVLPGPLPDGRSGGACAGVGCALRSASRSARRPCWSSRDLPVAVRPQPPRVARSAC